MDACAAEGAPTIQLTGPLVLGFQFNWALYGILSVQTYVYYQSRVPDKPLTKAIVYGLYVAETLQTILATHDGWHELALSWGDCAGLLALNLNWLSLPFITGITSCVIQCYYARRVYMVSKSKILAFVIVTLALMQGSAAIGEAITVLTLNNVPDTQSKTFKVTTVWLGGTAACDVLIACTMIYFLLKDRSKYRSADSVVTKIIRIALQTGLFTAVVAIIELCLFLIFKHNFYHLLPALMLSKLYSNSLLSLLNSRLTVDYRRGTEFHTSTATKRLKDEEASRTQGHTMSVGEDVQNNIAMVTFNSADDERDIVSDKTSERA